MQLELKASAEESDIKSQVKWRRRERTEMGTGGGGVGDGKWRGWGIGGWGVGGRASETAWGGVETRQSARGSMLCGTELRAVSHS